jgi:hypothetical protein
LHLTIFEQPLKKGFLAFCSCVYAITLKTL